MRSCRTIFNNVDDIRPDHVDLFGHVDETVRAWCRGCPQQESDYCPIEDEQSNLSGWQFGFFHANFLSRTVSDTTISLYSTDESKSPARVREGMPMFDACVKYLLSQYTESAMRVCSDSLCALPSIFLTATHSSSDYLSFALKKNPSFIIAVLTDIRYGTSRTSALQLLKKIPVTDVLSASSAETVARIVWNLTQGLQNGELSAMTSRVNLRSQSLLGSHTLSEEDPLSHPFPHSHDLAVHILHLNLSHRKRSSPT